MKPLTIQVTIFEDQYPLKDYIKVEVKLFNWVIIEEIREYKTITIEE